MKVNLIIIYFSIFCSQAFGIKNLFKKKALHIKPHIQKIEIIKKNEEEYYYEDWCCGEVQWENFEENDKKMFTIIIPEKKYLVCIDKSLDEKSEKSKKLKKSNTLCISSGLIKVLYKDIVNTGTFITQIQNIDYKHTISYRSLTDIFMISFIGIVSYGYNSSIKNEMNIIEKQRKVLNQKPITLQEIYNYLKLQKFVKTFTITLLFILTKNVKMAE